jgi:hypothetical protein
MVDGTLRNKEVITMKKIFDEDETFEDIMAEFRKRNTGMVIPDEQDAQEDRFGGVDIEFSEGTAIFEDIDFYETTESRIIRQVANEDGEKLHYVQRVRRPRLCPNGEFAPPLIRNGIVYVVPVACVAAHGIPSIVELVSDEYGRQLGTRRPDPLGLPLMAADQVRACSYCSRFCCPDHSAYYPLTRKIACPRHIRQAEKEFRINASRIYGRRFAGRLFQMMGVLREELVSPLDQDRGDVSHEQKKKPKQRGSQKRAEDTRGAVRYKARGE